MSVAVGCLFLLVHNLASGQIPKLSDHTIAVVAPAGAHLYAPGKWGILRVDLSNPLDEQVNLIATTYFVNDPTLQYGRRVWIPANARMQTWHPVRIPVTASQGGKRANLQTLLSYPDRKSEVLIGSDSGRLRFDGSIPVTEATPVTGIIDILRNAESEEEAAPVELLIAAESGEVRSRQNRYLSDRNLAAGEESLQALDQLVMVSGRVVDDAAGLEAIRRWLFGGGHLWVMLDRVDPQVLELILGDAFVCEVVGRVGLTTVRIESTNPHDDFRRSTQTFEQPVDLLRVAVADVDVAYTVDDWPAAFWKPCGEGWLLVTTLGARGWMQLRASADTASHQPAIPPDGRRPGLQVRGLPGPPPHNPVTTEPFARQSRFTPLNSMKGLAAKFFDSRPAPLLPETVLLPHIEKDIGYSIPPRRLIGWLLTALTLSVGGVGVYLWRRGRLEWLGWAGPALAVAFSGVLFALGGQHRHSIPATAASIEFVQPLPGTDDIRVQGIAGLYSPEAGAAEIKGVRGGWLLPEMAGMEGITRRMVWTDLDEWRWENLPAPAGLQSASFLASATTSERIEARATFDVHGIKGHLQTSPDFRPSDAVLVTRDGRIGVEFQSDGTFFARTADVFGPGQFLAAALVTDPQNRHRQILELLLQNPLRNDYPAEPQLLFWTDPWDLGFRFDADRTLRGTALVAVPLRWERPPLGTQVAVPAPLLPYRGSAGPDGSPPGGLWDYRTRRWLEKSGPSATWLRFQIPTPLLPVDVVHAHVVMQVMGPVGRIEIAGSRERAAVPVKTWIDPAGTLSLEIARPELLPVSPDGGLFLRVSGGDLEGDEPAHPDAAGSPRSNTWRIESLSVDLQVKTAAALHISEKPGSEK